MRASLGTSEPDVVDCVAQEELIGAPLVGRYGAVVFHEPAMRDVQWSGSLIAA